MGLFDSTQTQTSTQNANSTKDPWAAQSPYLTQGFASAQEALQKAQGAPTPDKFVAQFTPEMMQAYAQMMGYGTGNGNVPASSAAAGGALTGAGAQGAGQGLYGLSNFNPGNTTGAVTDAARAYSANPDVQGMIDAATRDARRSVNEQVLPGIERNAAATGNINSNRTGIAQGIVERGLADQVGDVSSQIRGNLYSQGLNLGQTQAAGNDQNRLAALGALTSGGTNAAYAGAKANTDSVAQQAGLFNIANAGIGGQLAGQQAGIDDPLKKFAFNNSAPFAALQNYWNVVGGQNWGGTKTATGTETTTGTKTPSTMAQLGAGIGALTSFF